MTEKKYKEVVPCGILYTFNREYFLLNPQPLARDSWQGDNAYRFVVVPNKPINDSVYADVEQPIYSFARHIVTNAFTIDYSPDMPAIKIWQLEDLDVTQMEWPFPDDSDEELDRLELEEAF